MQLFYVAWMASIFFCNGHILVVSNLTDKKTDESIQWQISDPFNGLDNNFNFRIFPKPFYWIATTQR